MFDVTLETHDICFNGQEFPTIILDDDAEDTLTFLHETLFCSPTVGLLRTSMLIPSTLFDLL